MKTRKFIDSLSFARNAELPLFARCYAVEIDCSVRPERYDSLLSETVSEIFLGKKKGNLYSEVRQQQYSTVHTVHMRVEKTGLGCRGR